jgi:hypothetical protein
MLEKFQTLTMSKPAITRLFKVAITFVVAGTVSGTAVVIWALANGAIGIGGPQFVTVNAGPVAGALVGLIIASLLTGIGTVAAVVSWAGALLNTARLEDKAWFSALLVLGLISLGWLAMIAYVLRGPDSTAAPVASAAQRASQSGPEPRAA